MTPPAGYPHNRRAQHVGLARWSAAPAELAVLMTGTQAVALDDGDGPCPDVLVFTPAGCTLAVAAAATLVVEVTSPGARSNDAVTTLEQYARAAIAHYWIVDPDRIAVYEFAPGQDRYREVQTGRCVHLTAPFPADVVLPDGGLPAATSVAEQLGKHLDRAVAGQTAADR